MSYTDEVLAIAANAQRAIMVVERDCDGVMASHAEPVDTSTEQVLNWAVA